jgi:hypothetical protein
MICGKLGSSDTGNDGNGEANVGKDPVDLGKISDVGRNMNNYGENTIKINRVISPHKPVDAGKARNP